MRPNDSAKPPGVQASRLATARSAANTSTAPSASAQHAAAEAARTAMRVRSMRRAARRGKQRQQHGQRRAVRGGGDRDQHDQADALAAAQRFAAQQQEIKRQHAEPAEDIGEQDRGQPGQGGERPQSAAMMPSRSSGRLPKPCARNISAMTQTVSADLQRAAPARNPAARRH